MGPPQPRRQQQQQQQQQQPAFSSFSARQPEAAPQQQSFPTFTARDPPGVPQRKSSPIRIAPPAPKPAAAQPAFRPTPKSADFRPTRPAPPPTVAAVRKLPEPRPSSESSRGGSTSEFSNFPARDNPSRTRSRPSRPAAAPAPAAAKPSQRFQAVPANPEPQMPAVSVPETPRQATNPARGRQRLNATPSRSQASQAPAQPQSFPAAPQAPAFRPPPQQQQQQQQAFPPQQQQAFPPQQQQPQAFPPQQNVFQSGSLRPAFEDVRPGSSGQSQASFNTFPAVNSASGPGFNRPALTFQEPATNDVPANLPKSALEIVDFNQLVQEFQGSLRPQAQATNTFSQNNAAVFSNPQNTQTRFSTNNFPVRF